MEEIKNEILEFIKQLYHKKYIGKLIVTEIKPIGYQVKFGLNNIDKPLVISAELPKDQFLKFMYQEIKDRRMDFVKYFIGVKTYPNQGCNYNKSCSCNGEFK